ncbi:MULTISPECIES: L-2-amino-thiazoline-4-carboxylic acid hydrolase [Thalassobaculum]|uniref:L-2-amino-thiazoline-4-carboxylic acid hydrolase n=1 Tax=Thalassobaculum litoreum DSM 18839 TaxID=1123362 RepID=A0A8G2BDY7_9PROT|nr:MULTISPECIES: L-2-amino-thiazoline-4-carboxylic acid hydrolase [Thalassobaculum]SDF09024.1 L-2-amino-thiazoline-4-carboxylic acid hydrolase [Thalassobaculum litoreum DSM 18839]
MADRLPILEQRRIEAEVIKPIYEEMVAQLGKAQAQDILDSAIRKAAIAQGQSFAAEAEGGTDLDSFADIQKHWTASGALEIEPVDRTPETLDFNVTRCRYSEMYKAMGLGEIGHLLSCNRDGTFCEGYDPRIKLERTQTLMGGASHCDFRYTFEE